MTNADHLKIAGMFRDEAAAKAFRAGCGSLNGHRLDTYSGALSEIRPGMQRLAACDVLLLEIDPADAAQVNDLAAVLEAFPGKPVLATTPQLSVQDIRKLLHLGVIDVLPQPLGADDLDGALRQVMRAHLAPRKATAMHRGRKIVFLKATGGVGATTLAVQSGCLLAEAPKRHAAPKVCLFDFDIQQGSAGLHLDLPPCEQFTDLAGDPDRMDDALLEGLLAHHASGLGVLTAPPQIMPLETLDPAFVLAMIDTAARVKDYVLIDLPSAWTDWKLVALQSADIVLLVTELTVPGVHHARMQLDTLAEQGLADLPVTVVVNRYSRRVAGSVAIANAEKALDRPINYRIRDDGATVNEAINQGVALRHIKRRSKVEKSLRELVGGVVRQPIQSRAEPSLRADTHVMLEVR